MIFIEGVKAKFIYPNGDVVEASMVNNRFYVRKDDVYKLDLINKTVWVEVPGVGIDIYEVDGDMLKRIKGELVGI